jgi:hypothetical protein
MISTFYVSPFQAKSTYLNLKKLRVTTSTLNCFVLLTQSFSSFSIHLTVIFFFPTMEDGKWVLVRRSSQKDLWRPSLPNADDEPSRPLKVTFSEPAEYWTDAIPIGNGRLGAMIWGGVQSEVLQLNGKKINHFLL